MSDGVLGLPALDDREALRNFIDAMKVAESAAKQMAFYTSEPAWLKIENALAGTRTLATSISLASFNRRLRA